MTPGRRPPEHPGSLVADRHHSVSRTKVEAGTMSLTGPSESLLQRIRFEFRENPELRLTPWQLRHKWALSPNESHAVIQQLLTTGFLVEDQDGALMRDERWATTRRSQPEK